MNLVTGKEAFCRKTLTPLPETLFFIPDSLTPETLASSVIKRASFGGCFKGEFDVLPSTYARVVWECAVVKAPPEHIRPLRPKMFLCTKLVLEAGYYYILK